MKRLMRYLAGMMLAGGMAGMGIAGDIDSPGSPSAGSGMYTFKQIYDYLSAGTVSPIAESFQEPIAGPGSTMYTTKQIYEAVATPFPQCDASAADVKTGKKFFCTQSGSWGVQTGSMSTESTWYQTYGPSGSDQVVKIEEVYSGGDIYVAKWINNAGTASNGTKTYSEATSWASGLNWCGRNDWQIPTDVVINAICANKNLLGAYSSGNYWGPADYGISFTDCGWNFVSGGTCYVRAWRWAD